MILNFGFFLFGFRGSSGLKVLLRGSLSFFMNFKRRKVMIFILLVGKLKFRDRKLFVREFYDDNG